MTHNKTYFTRLASGLRTLLVGALWLALAASAAKTTHDFYSYIDRSIFVSTDDSEANIAYALAADGRYSFPASPVLAGEDRTRGQFNYGPWYFYLASGLIWVFGFSLTLVRSIHLWVILGAIAGSAFWFRGRDRLIATAVFGFGLLYCFEVSHWPMARPDILVSLFALGLVTSAGAGLLRSRWPAWFGAGLAATCGAFTHLIAFSLVPSAFVLFAVSVVVEALENRDRRAVGVIVLRSFLGLAAGMACGLLMFYGSFGFEFATQYRFLTAYRELTASPVSLSAALGAHLTYAFGYLSRQMQVVVAVTLLAGWVVPVLGWWLSPASRRQVAAYLLPPVVVWSAYLASNGYYTNYHQGYAILHQVMFLWTAAALTWLGLWAARERFPRIGAALAWVVLIALTAQAGRQLQWQWSGESWKVQRTAIWAPFSEYANQVLGTLPARATAWGTIMFGLEAPDRIQLVQWSDAVGLYGRLSLEDRIALLPDYIVWGYPEARDNMLSVTRGGESLLSKTSELMAAAPIRLVSLVAGAPYGVTRTYARHLGVGDRARATPTVSVYDPSHRQWLNRLGTPIEAAFTPVPVVPLRIGYESSPPEARPVATVMADLPADRYLLRVELKPGAGETARRLLAVTSTNMLRQTMGEGGPDGDFASYLEHDTEMYMLAIHPGGPLYVSQFDSGTAPSIGTVTAYPIVGLLDPNEQPRHARSLPPLSAWTAVTGVTAQSDGATLRVAGDTSVNGYQLMSPLIGARQHNRITVRTPLKVEDGKVCVGVLNGNGAAWLVGPDVARGEVQFLVDETQGFRVVVANCNPANGGAPSRFVLWPGDYLDEPVGTSYADFLVAAALHPEAARAAERAGPEVQTVPPGLIVTRVEVEGPVEALTPNDMDYRASLAGFENGVWALAGKAEGPFTYVLQSKPRALRADNRLLVSGRVSQGGMSVGLLKNNQWAAQLNITDPGDFTVVIAPPGRGTYTIVVAHNLPKSLETSIQLTRFGMLPLK